MKANTVLDSGAIEDSILTHDVPFSPIARFNRKTLNVELRIREAIRLNEDTLRVFYYDKPLTLNLEEFVLSILEHEDLHKALFRFLDSGRERKDNTTAKLDSLFHEGKEDLRQWISNYRGAFS